LKGELIPLVIVAALIPFIPHYLIKEHATQALYSHSWIENWSLLNLFKKDFKTVDGNAHYTFPNLVYAFLNFADVRFCFVGIVGLFFVAKHFKRNVFILCCIVSFLLYALFLAGIPFQNLRFLCLSFPLAVIILVPGIVDAIDFIPQKLLTWAFVFCFIIQGILTGLCLKPFITYNRNEREIASSILNQPYKTIYTFSMKPVLENYGVKQKIISLHDSLISSVDSNACFLFNEQQFEIQMKGTPYMKKWEHVKNKFELKKIVTYANGWALYEIK
jgi:hypothetical protein